MSHIVFFEKPGCGGNARQKQWLLDAGHTLDVRSLLAEPWTPGALLAWLAPLAVADWFNRSAPRVKSGEIVPDSLDRDTARRSRARSEGCAAGMGEGGCAPP